MTRRQDKIWNNDGYVTDSYTLGLNELSIIAKKQVKTSIYDNIILIALTSLKLVEDISL